VNSSRGGSGDSPRQAAAELRASPAPEEWLSTEHLPLAEQIDRLAADSDLVQDLRSRGFNGPDYRYFESVLAGYGQAVIAGWMHRRTIEAKCREKRLRHVPQLDGIVFTNDDIDEVVLETVAEALFYYRDRVLLLDRWDADRGASLRTFFVGQCLIRFVSVMNRWLTEQSRDVLGIDEDLREDEVADATDVETDVINALTAHQALQHVTRADARLALTLRSQGHTVREIANQMARTEKSVEGMIGYAKRQIRQHTLGRESA
jgi:DNA-directed RNA polymerase specialized sigma24 family protein